MKQNSNSNSKRQARLRQFEASLRLAYDALDRAWDKSKSLVGDDNEITRLVECCTSIINLGECVRDAVIFATNAHKQRVQGEALKLKALLEETSTPGDRQSWAIRVRGEGQVGRFVNKESNGSSDAMGGQRGIGGNDRNQGMGEVEGKEGPQGREG